MEWQQAREYCNQLGMTDAQVDHVEAIFSFYQAHLDEGIQEIFISERAGDERRSFESLWLFTDELIMEAKRLESQFNVDFAPLEDEIIHLVLKKVNLDLGDANAESRLYVRYNTDPDIGGELRASGENCDRLYNVYRHYLLPNLR